MYNTVLVVNRNILYNLLFVIAVSDLFNILHIIHFNKSNFDYAN